MNNLEIWKAARTAWLATEREYAIARRIMMEAVEKKTTAWGDVVAAAGNLSPNEKILAAEYEFGPRQHD